MPGMCLVHPGGNRKIGSKTHECPIVPTTSRTPPSPTAHRTGRHRRDGRRPSGKYRRNRGRAIGEHSDQRQDPGPGGDGSPREVADPGSGVQADLRVGEPEQPHRDREPDGREEPADRVAGVAARDERAHRAVGRDRQTEQGRRDGVGRRGGEHQDQGAEPDRERAEPHAVGQPSGGRGLHAWHRGSRARGFQGGSPAHARARTPPSLGCWHPPDVVVAAGSSPARSARSVASG